MTYVNLERPNTQGFYPGYRPIGQGFAGMARPRFSFRPPGQGEFIAPKVGRPGALTSPIAGQILHGGQAAPGTSQQPADPGSMMSQGQGYDPSTDPIVAQIQAMGSQSVADAVASADALRKQLLIKYGDPNLVKQTPFGDIGAGGMGDANTAAAADQNPFSTVKTLLHNHTVADQNLDNAANSRNYYYGSAHANELGQENQNYLGNVSQAQSTVEGQLSQIVSQLLAAHQAAQDATLNAQMQAYQNWLASGGYGTSTGGGTPSGGGVAQQLVNLIHY